MFKFFFDKKHIKDNLQNLSDIDQTKIIDNYNELADAFSYYQGVNLEKLNSAGVCYGLSINYLLFAKEGGKDDKLLRRDEFYRYLELIYSLDSTTIQEIANKNPWHLSIRFKASFDKVEQHIPMNRVLEFLRVISVSQENQMIKIIRGNWETSYLAFCHRDGLANELNKAFKKAERTGINLISASIGRHAFAIETTAKGYYIFEPNSITRHLFKSVEEVANFINKNHSIFRSANQKVALLLNFISYGNKNREIDDLISKFDGMLNSENSKDFELEKNIINQYHKGMVSRHELALSLHRYLKEHLTLLPQKILNFYKELTTHIVKKGISTQSMMSEQLNKVTNSTAYTYNINGLHLAARDNQISILKEMLEMNFDPNVQSSKGITPLFTASEHGHTDCIKLLLAHPDTDPNLTSVAGATPLYVAAQEGQVDSVKLLLSHSNINLDLYDENKKTPLYIASLNGNKECVDLLLDKGAKYDMPAKVSVNFLLSSAENPDQKMALESLLKNFLQLDTFDHNTKLRGFNALHAAALLGHTEIVLSLINHGADINSSASGITPLDLAKAMKHEAIVEILENPSLNLTVNKFR